MAESVAEPLQTRSTPALGRAVGRVYRRPGEDCQYDVGQTKPPCKLLPNGRDAYLTQSAVHRTSRMAREEFRLGPLQARLSHERPALAKLGSKGTRI